MASNPLFVCFVFAKFRKEGQWYKEVPIVRRQEKRNQPKDLPFVERAKVALCL